MPARVEDPVTVTPPEPRPLSPRGAAIWLNNVAQVQQKPLGLATALITLIIIAALTLTPQGSILPDHFDTCIFCGRYGTADFVLNVMLFMPLGFGLRLAGVRRRWAVLIPLALSATIETLQYFVVPGRDSDLGDIVANTLGAALGISIANVRRLLLAPSPTQARSLVGAWVLICGAAAAGLGWALRPQLPTSIYYGQVAPDFARYAPFDGTVYRATFNDAPFLDGRLSPDSSATMRAALLTSGTAIATWIRAGTWRYRLAPILSVADGHRREIFMLGRRFNDLTFRLRRRSDNLGFHPPSAVLANALAKNRVTGDTVGVTVVLQPGSIILQVEGQIARAQRQIGLGVWGAWRLFVPDDGAFGKHDDLWTLVTMIGLWLPLGYWTARMRGVSRVAGAVSVVIALVGTLAIIPWIVASPPAPSWIWLVSLATLGIAWMFSRWTET